MAEQFNIRKFIRNPEPKLVEIMEPSLVEKAVSPLAKTVEPREAAEKKDEPKVVPTLTLIFDEEVNCGFCKGRGERPPGSICPVCRRNGTINVIPPVVKCARCRGRGDEKPRVHVTCSSCRGLGYVSVTEPIEKCSSCHGTGTSGGSKLACLQCKGAGVVSIKQ